MEDLGKNKFVENTNTMVQYSTIQYLKNPEKEDACAVPWDCLLTGTYLITAGIMIPKIYNAIKELF